MLRDRNRLTIRHDRTGALGKGLNKARTYMKADEAA